LIKFEINELQTQLSSIKAEEKKARASLSALKAKPRIVELQQDIQRLGCERDDMQARLAKLNEGPEVTVTATATATAMTMAMAIQITPEERSQLEQEWKIWYRQATIRRRICRKMWDRCSEVLPENTSVLELWVNIPPRLPYHQWFANALLTWLQESLGLEGALQ
jgi:26S proteasome regulatory subunit (ATPase 3-interacting protein)